MTSPDQIASMVDDSQRVAVTASGGPLLVVAGPGSGKTHTIICRIAYRAAVGDMPGRHVLAVTHSARAAGELHSRLTDVGVPGVRHAQTRTIHAAALRQLKHFWRYTGRGGQAQVCDNRFGVARSALAACGVRNPDTGTIVDMLSEIEWAKARLLTPGRYARAAERAGRSSDLSAAVVGKVFRTYQKLLDDNGLLDYTDILTVCGSLLRENPQVAEQVRAQYRSIYVDEYQDVDPAQQQLIDMWVTPDTSDITVVGDPRQSIYGFKGATPGIVAAFPQSHADSRVVTLVKDYRSSPQIVAVANSLSAASRTVAVARPKSGRARASWDAAHPAPLEAAGPSGPDVATHVAPDPEKEAAWVAARARSAIESGIPAGQIAVLYRFNSQSALFEQALTDAGVAHRVAGGELFFERAEIQTLLRRYLQRIDELSGGTPDIGGSDLLREVACDTGWDRDNPPAGVGARRDRWEGVAALIRMVENTDGLSCLEPKPLGDELMMRRSHAHHGNVNAVVLTTIHKAKGLEWDVVFCPGWVEGQLPSWQSLSGAGAEEERRVAYVAASRARRHLAVSWHLGRSGRKGDVKPSRFIAEAGLAVVPFARAGRKAGGVGAARCRKCHTVVRNVVLANEELCEHHLPGQAGKHLAKLRRWRRETAAAESIPVYRVLSDQSVFHICLHPPGSKEELAEVPGIGPVKQEKYGESLLGALALPTG